MRQKLSLVLAIFVVAAAHGQTPTRVGIIGCDTSHVPAFTKLLNNAPADSPLGGFKVVAAFPGGSKDYKPSYTRVEMFTEQLRKDYGVEIVKSIEELVSKVDVVLLESVDGRPHLEQVIPVLKAGKRCFIDKPVAASLADAIQIFELSKKYNTPVFSSSSLRFSSNIENLRKDEKLGSVLGIVVHSPCEYGEFHPDLFWYGIHGVEAMFAIMGPGCKTVSRVHTPDADVVTGVWKDGRIATYRGVRKGNKGYGAYVFGSKSNGPADISAKEGYRLLLEEICKFFKTGIPPVSPTETIEVIAFMEAADESKRLNGAPVHIDDIIQKASKRK
jgi:hypothetical protein